MITKRRWKRYQRCKDSGIEWLGEVPERWRIVRLRYSACINPPKTEVSELQSDTPVSFIPMDAVGEYGGINLTQSKKITEVFYGYTYFRENDVLVAKITPCFENGKGAIAENLESGIGFGTTELHVIRPNEELDRVYLFYFTISHPFRRIGDSHMYGAGGQKRISPDFVSNFRIPTPPVQSQKQIVLFLVHIDRKIDVLISKKQRQIELLEEKRAAVISHAVTKGLNLDAKMKGSGIEWLGEIPEHWDMIRLKFVSVVQAGLTLGKRWGNRKVQTRPYLRVANVQDGYLNLSTITDVQIPSEETYKYELKHGDVLMTEGGDFDKLGRGYVWEDQISNCLHQNHIFAVRLNQTEMSSYYLSALLTSSHGKNYFTSTSQQTTNLATTNRTKLLSFPLPLPPMNEQKAILKYLQSNTANLKALIAKVHLSIEKLKEYRTALITAAVTGKIDVREEAA